MSAAGISLRTFYRYCAAKEDALTPVLTSSVGAASSGSPTGSSTDR